MEGEEQVCAGAGGTSAENVTTNEAVISPDVQVGAPPPATPANPVEYQETCPAEGTDEVLEDKKPATTAGAVSEAVTGRLTPSTQRYVLHGTLIGLFVVVDPAIQRAKMSVKRELETLGVFQRDVGPTEEVQLSLEQAFYLVYDLDRLRVCLPPGDGRWRGFGEKKEVEGGYIEESRGLGAEAAADERGDKGAVGDGQAQARPLSAIECWKAFRAASPTFLRSVGSYRFFRKRGFVVHGGLNLGLDFMLYRGTPQRYHAEFGVLLRYPSSSPPGHRDGEGAGDGGLRLTWRDLHLLYRLIGEVRKTLILGHIRLGRADEGEDGGGLRPAGGAGASRAEGEDGSSEVGRGDQGAERGEEEGEEEDCEVRREIRQWYSGLSVYEVAVTPWRGGTPLARSKLSKKKSEAAQIKGGAGGGVGSGKKRRRGGGEGGRDSAASGEKHVNRQQNA